MNRQQQDWDYRLYKIYIWGGLPLIVIYILVSVLVFDALRLPGPIKFLVIMGPELLWIAGIFLYWWCVFLFKGNKELADLRHVQDEKVPGIKALQSWNTLHQAMATHGGNVEAFIRYAKSAKRPILVWYGILNMMAVWILCPIILGSLDIFNPEGKTWGWIWLGGIFVGVALMSVAVPFLAGRSSKNAKKAYLSPLGLAVTDIPSLDVDANALFGGGQKLIPEGPAIVEGVRNGHLIHIETIDTHSLTVLWAEIPGFKAQSNDGKLVPNPGAPETVVQALKSLRKAKRWRGIIVYAGPEGIAIQRQSKGTNMWLYDLWLAEYLVNGISAGLK